VSELLGSWRGQLGNRLALHMEDDSIVFDVMSRAGVPEWNVCNFDDCENSLLNLKKFVLQTLYTWRVAWNTVFVCTFSEFLALCSCFSMD
jgi:hypothetical protein